MAGVVQPLPLVSKPAPVALRTPWRWSQQWQGVLFLHWPAPQEWLRQQLPDALQMDTFQDEAWVSLIGFRLRHVRLHGLPALPFCSQMLELNFRTYVVYRGEPAICFLTMHADHRPMVWAAQCLTPLPYAMATLTHRSRGAMNGFSCQPHSDRSPLLAAEFRLGEALGPARPDSLDAWLTERYVAYVADSRGQLWRMPVQHEPWQLREITLERCQVGLPQLQNVQPKCHYSDGTEALLWPFEASGG